LPPLNDSSLTRPNTLTPCRLPRRHGQNPTARGAALEPLGCHAPGVIRITVSPPSAPLSSRCHNVSYMCRTAKDLLNSAGGTADHDPHGPGGAHTLGAVLRHIAPLKMPSQHLSAATSPSLQGHLVVYGETSAQPAALKKRRGHDLDRLQEQRAVYRILFQPRHSGHPHPVSRQT
jgi:hypothetical protein